MIARVAENCFWLHRYVERMENTARLLRTNRSIILDFDLPHPERWRPVVVVCGEQERITDRFGREALDDAELVQKYLTWDEHNPVSVISSVRWARENARTIREAISVDMWEALNGFWHWLRSGQGRRLFRTNRDDFYQRVQDWPHQFYGLTLSTLLHDEPYHFMQLGMLLERAAQTARLLDVRHHVLEVAERKVGSALENASWLVLLHTCSAVEIFYRTYRQAAYGPHVAELLFLAPAFPRSTAYCVDHAARFLERIRPSLDSPVGARSAHLITSLRERLRSQEIETVLEAGLHEELTYTVDALAEICDAVQQDYFAGRLTPTGVSSTRPQ